MEPMSSSLFTAWLTFFYLLRWSTSALGADTVTTSVQNDPHFMGWYIAPTTTQALMDPAFWSTSGNYARGCLTNPCSVATACQDNMITYDNGKTGDCNMCRTMTIFQTSPFGAPSATNIFCAENWNAFHIYRELPVPTTTSDSTLTTSVPSTSSSTQSSQTTIAIESTSSSPEPATSHTSRAWIAGAVVGPIAAVGIFAAIICWLLYRRRRTQRTPPAYPATNQGFPEQQKFYGDVQEMDTANTSPLYELGSHDHR